MNPIITVGRQFGAGGREIGKKLAETLGIPYYDKELLAEAAHISGLCKEYLEQKDENSTNSLMYSLVMGTQTLTGYPSLEELTQKAYRDAVESVSGQGGCVIVGRSADYILKGNPRLLRVFLSASEDFRIQRVCKRDNLSPKEAAVKLHRMDRTRSAYYHTMTGQKWGNAENYDLCVHVSRFGTPKTLQMILDAAKNLEITQ